MFVVFLIRNTNHVCRVGISEEEIVKAIKMLNSGGGERRTRSTVELIIYAWGRYIAKIRKAIV